MLISSQPLQLHVHHISYLCVTRHRVLARLVAREGRAPPPFSPSERQRPSHILGKNWKMKNSVSVFRLITIFTSDSRAAGCGAIDVLWLMSGRTASSVSPHVTTRDVRIQLFYRSSVLCRESYRLLRFHQFHRSQQYWKDSWHEQADA